MVATCRRDSIAIAMGCTQSSASACVLCLQDNSTFQVRLLAAKNHVMQPFYTAGITSGCVTEQVDLTSADFDLSDPAHPENEACPSMLFSCGVQKLPR
jgi:hypothetical protein